MPFTYLALGDSYTIGENLKQQDSFPFQLVSILSKSGIDFTPPTVIAKTGWTTSELLAAIDRTKLKSSYDFVTLLIGVNNQYRNESLSTYKIEFDKLLNLAIGFTGKHPWHVMVVSIPDWGTTPFAEGRDKVQIAKEIDSFNEVNKRISDQYNVGYLDITARSRADGMKPQNLTSDLLHYSPVEYTHWASEIADRISKVFSF